MPPEEIALVDQLCPGDVTVLTAAVEMLARQHPGRYRIGVRTHHNAIFDHNPHVSPVSAGARAVPLDFGPEIHGSNARPIHFMEGYVGALRRALGVPLELLTSRPHLYLSAQEKAFPHHLLREGRYCVVNAGHKRDFTAKWWGKDNYQSLVDRLKDRVAVVQVGSQSDLHPRLSGVVDLVGKTSLRDVIHLAQHADFGVGPSTFLQHVFAALERPYVCFLGGREPVCWTHYPTQVTLGGQGLDCCRRGACWRNKTVKVDGDSSLCDRPLMVGSDAVPECLHQHAPERVAEICKRFIRGGPMAAALDSAERLMGDEPVLGVVIGTHGSAGYVELHLAALRAFAPQLPALVVDDCSDEGRDLARLCRKYGADFQQNASRLEHVAGDLNVFRAGLLWAETKGVELLCKFSRRWIWRGDWRPALLRLVKDSQYPTYSSRCDFHGFGFRTESLALHVPSWLRGHMVEDIRDRTARKDWFLPEAFVHRHAEMVAARVQCKANKEYAARENRPNDAGAYGHWVEMGNSRRVPGERHLWHEANAPEDYHALARSLGVDRPVSDFRI